MKLPPSIVLVVGIAAVKTLVGVDAFFTREIYSYTYYHFHSHSHFQSHSHYQSTSQTTQLYAADPGDASFYKPDDQSDTFQLNRQQQQRRFSGFESIQEQVSFSNSKANNQQPPTIILSGASQLPGLSILNDALTLPTTNPSSSSSPYESPDAQQPTYQSTSGDSTQKPLHRYQPPQPQSTTVTVAPTAATSTKTRTATTATTTATTTQPPQTPRLSTTILPQQEAQTTMSSWQQQEQQQQQQQQQQQPPPRPRFTSFRPDDFVVGRSMTPKRPPSVQFDDAIPREMIQPNPPPQPRTNRNFASSTAPVRDDTNSDDDNVIRWRPGTSQKQDITQQLNNALQQRQAAEQAASSTLNDAMNALEKLKSTRAKRVGDLSTQLSDIHSSLEQFERKPSASSSSSSVPLQPPPTGSNESRLQGLLERANQSLNSLQAEKMQAVQRVMAAEAKIQELQMALQSGGTAGMRDTATTTLNQKVQSQMEAKLSELQALLNKANQAEARAREQLQEALKTATPEGVATLKTEKDKLDADLVAARAQVETAEKNSKEWKQKLQTESEQVKKLRSQVEVLEGDKVRLVQAANLAEKQKQAATAAMQKQLDEAKKELVAAKQAQQSLETTVSQYKKKLDAMEKEMGESKQRTDPGLQAELLELKAVLKEAYERLQSSENENYRLKQSNDEESISQVEAALKVELEQAKKEAESSSDQVKILEARMAEYQERLEQKDKELQSAQKETSSTAQIDELRSLLRAAYERIQQSEATALRVEGLMKEVSTLSETLRTKEAQIKKLEASQMDETLLRALESLKRDYKETMDENESLRTKLSQLETPIEDLTSSMPAAVEGKEPELEQEGAMTSIKSAKNETISSSVKSPDDGTTVASETKLPKSDETEADNIAKDNLRVEIQWAEAPFSKGENAEDK